jgi:hypothetical protein
MTIPEAGALSSVSRSLADTQQAHVGGVTNSETVLELLSKVQAAIKPAIQSHKEISLPSQSGWQPTDLSDIASQFFGSGSSN